MIYPCPRTCGNLLKVQGRPEYWCPGCQSTYPADRIEPEIDEYPIRGERLVTSTPKGEARAEKALQRLCELELTRRGVEFLHISHRAREKKGWPDLTFCIQGKAFAVELKTATGALSDDQKRVLAGLERDGWHVHVVRGFDAFLEAVGKWSTE